jgi:hypothetical protein
MNKFLEDNVLGLPETTLLNISPKDILVVKVDSKYTTAAAEELGRQVKHILPKNKVIIIPNNVEFFVIPESAEVISVGVK